MTSYSHLSAETHVFLDSLSVCWTRFSEDELLEEEWLRMKVKFQGKSIDMSPSELKQCILRAIFLEMLGYEAQFIYIHAINLTQSSTYALKRLGYLACCLFLNETSEVLILLIATIQKDLQSSKSAIIKLALITISRFLCPEFIENTHALITALLKHEQREIKVRALMVLYQMYRYSPSLIGPFEKILKPFMTDNHLKTISVVCNILYEEARKKPYDYVDLLDNIIKLGNALFLKKMREDQGFYLIRSRILDSKAFVEVPPPWVLIKLLQTMSKIVGENKANSEKCYPFLFEIVKDYSRVNSIATDSVLFECMKTIFNIFPNQDLIRRCCETLSIYLNQRNEQKYMGIKTLLCLSEQNLKFVNQYQDEIISCLENNDFMIKRKTLLLLAKIANLENIGIVLPKLLKYLQMETDEFFKKLLVNRIFELFEKFTPDPNFFMVFGSEFIKFGGNLVSDEIKNQFIKLIYSIFLLDKEGMGSLITNFFRDMIIYESNLPENLIQISAWILGEIGSEIYSNDKKTLVSLIVTLKEKFLMNVYEKDTLAWILNALIKINSQTQYDLSYFLKKFHLSKDIDLTQRLREFDLSTKFCFLRDSQILCETDSSLSFLDSYVLKFTNMGYKQYSSKHKLKEASESTEPTSKTTIEEDSKIRFEGKKVWGNQINELPNDTEKPRNHKGRISVNEVKTAETIKADKKEEEGKPIAYVQSPNEEFASKVFKGILEESRKREAKLLGISIRQKKDVEIPNLLEEDKVALNPEWDNKKEEFLISVNDHIANNAISEIEGLFFRMEQNLEQTLECEVLGSNEIKRLVDNFSLRIFEKSSNGLENKFVIVGIKSNEVVICLGEENFEKTILKFRSSSQNVLNSLLGFVKEYFKKMGFKYLK